MYKNLYKKGIDHIEMQKQRQREMLDLQRKAREELIDERRALESHHSPRRSIKPLYFRDYYGFQLRLQYSEWLHEKPDALEDWMLVPCPKGQRCLVVACSGFTRVFSKYGKHLWTIKTMLPGQRGSDRIMTVLDCFYHNLQKEYYVVDALAYGRQDLRECTAEFRRHWLRSQFAENEELGVRSERNEAPFKLLEWHDMAADNVPEVFKQHPYWPAPEGPKFDGYLFYHKQSHYVGGKTPLVCWLFGFMVKDMLDYEVSNVHEPPPEYEPKQPEKYIKLFDEQQAAKRSYRTHKLQINPVVALGEAENKNSPNFASSEPMDTQVATSNNDDDNYTLSKEMDDQRRLEMGLADDDFDDLQES